MKIDIKSMLPEEIDDLTKKMNLPQFRSKQIVNWLSKGIDSFDEMSNIPKDIRERLSAECELKNAEIVERFDSKLDETSRFLFSLNDGEYIESVLMSYNHGYSLCISTQAGCRMGCKFCASTVNGLKRNLTTSEMLSQIYEVQKSRNVRVSNIVLMGMGEPLDNYENVLKFLKLVSNPQGLNIGMRHISLSTCGLVDKIDILAEEKLQLTLSVSLHAPSDEIRTKMMPINKKWGVYSLLKACARYADKTGRRISFEYAVVDGVNDSDECAVLLSKKLKNMLAHINLIPLNNIEKSSLKPSKNVLRFCETLKKNGINATVRRTLGSDINASCGQLAGKKPK